MESLFYRYRNIIVLLVVIFAQLVLLAWQVKSDTDVPLVRVWAVTAVMPVAGAIESLRNTTAGFFSNYFELRNARQQSRELRTEVDKLRLENQFLRNELASAQRAEALAGFQAHNPSKMIGARVIGATPGMGTKSVLIDRGSQTGVRRGMAVVTPEGIVGRVIAVFPFASQVLSVTDPEFAAGVESQKNHVHGVLKGTGNGGARVESVPLGQKVENGEMFFTSGEDRVFPKGLPVGKVTSVRDGSNFLDIVVDPAGAEAAPEEVLVIVDPVHQGIPEAPASDAPVFLAPDIRSDERSAQPGAGLTAADEIRDQYKKIGEAQKHVFGEGLPGSPPPNFNLKVPGVNSPALPPGTAQPERPQPPASGVKASPSTAPVPKPADTAPARPPVNKPAASTPVAPVSAIPRNNPAPAAPLRSEPARSPAQQLPPGPSATEPRRSATEPRP